MVSRLYISALLLITMFISGCVIQPLSPPSAGGNGTRQIADDGAQVEAADGSMIAAYVLKPLDPIYIRFSGVSDQQALDIVIDEKGEINLLHIPDRVMAAGHTTSELEDLIERLYIDSGIYKTVSVSVTMTAKTFYVQGEVMQPGQFQLTSGTTLLQAIAGARGYTQFANKKKVTITRQGKIYKFNMKDIEEDPSKDVKIEAGDVIKVWQSLI